MPPASAISEAISVSSIAATQRKTSVSTIIATARPISSPTGAGSCSAWSTIGPRRETSRPACSPMPRPSRAARPAPAEVLRGLVVLDGEEADPPVARDLPALQRRDAGHVRLALDRRRGRRRSRRAGPSSVPALDGEDDVAVSPDWAGKRCVRRSSACWDSVPGVREVVDEVAAAGGRARAEGDQDATTIARERFQCPAAASGETSEVGGPCASGITLAAKLQSSAYLHLCACNCGYDCRMTDAGLRERKKQRTREQIVDAALAPLRRARLPGDDVADIAAAADIAPRTFFAYFPSKEAVVFHDFDEMFESLRATIERPPGGRDRDRRAAPLDRALAAGQARGGRGRGPPQAPVRRRAGPRGVPEAPVVPARGDPARRRRPRPRRARRRPAPEARLRRRGGRAERDRRRRADKAESMALLDETLVFLRGGVAALQNRGG